VPEIVIPYKQRNWAKPFHASTRRFAALILHRRAGKTTALMNHHQRAAMDDDWERRRLMALAPTLTVPQLEELVHPPGGRLYCHILPTRKQAKETVWDRLKHYADVIPGAVPNEADLMIRYPTGHKFQLFGADNPDSMRGLGPSGISFDEFSQQPANIFSEIFSKALADHLGYAVFAGTIKGKDHLYRAYDATRDDPAWFSLWQDVDTSLATEDGVTIQLLEQAMADDRAMIAQGLMTQDEYDQEWFLSPEAAIKGAIYGKELTAARQTGRIGNVPHDPSLPVNTYWDLGMNMAIWFEQSTRSGEVRLIDYYESGGTSSLPECVNVLKGKPYTYERHVAPHDIVVKELASGRSRLESAAALGVRFDIAPKVSIQDGINAVKLLLPRCYFDATKCAAGLEALRNYRRDFNTRLNEFKEEPLHNWASHGADGFRYLAVRQQTPTERHVTPAPYRPTVVWG
jgi:phage terminase large subunit